MPWFDTNVPSHPDLDLDVEQAAAAWRAELDRRDAAITEDALTDAATVHARVRETLRRRRIAP